jgi:hypothetical protein
MQIETFECSEVSAEPVDASAEAIELIDSLGLDGQRDLVCPATAPGQSTRFPYREMLKEEVNVYEMLCPKKSPIAKYTSSAIPLRVLQCAAHAKQMKPELNLYVWDRDSAVENDPVLVAEIGESYSVKTRYILARWGEELEAFAVLFTRAVVLKRKLIAGKARELLADAERLPDATIIGKSTTWWW